MGKRKQVLAFAVLFSILLTMSVFFASGTVNVSKLSSLILGPTDSTASVFVTPAAIVRDYTLAPIGSTWTFSVNISSVADLFSWQINMTWNPAVLNVQQLTAGEFLLRTSSANKTSSYVLGHVINATDNVKGYSGMAETILGAVSGITGSGRLVSIAFLVVGYGRTDLTISLIGNLQTTLLDSAGGSIAFTTTKGYFDNRIRGDITGPAGPGMYDGIVNAYDLGYIGSYFGTSNTIADYTGPAGVPDGIVNAYDLGGVGANFGRHYP